MTSHLFADELLTAATRRYPESTLTHRADLPARPATYADWPSWVLPELIDVLSSAGLTRPYTHQVETAEKAWSGEDVVVATGTSSGKSLGYQLPILTMLAQEKNACALYLTPTKALGSDQLASVQKLVRAIPALDSVHPAPYDGDTPTDARASIRDHSRFIFSNPDMLHASLLGAHERWPRLLRNLQFIVIDECHSYRGVFGANVALVIRRLLRLARNYGAEPVVILASATSVDPAAAAQRLTGRPAHAVTEDGSPTGRRTVALWEPGFIEGAEGEHGAPVRRAATTEGAGLMATVVAEGARTLTFVRSRVSAETVSLRAAEELGSMGRPDFGARIASYRAGYLAEDRRQLERDLDEGRLLGVAATNALELGIDVGGLDVVITAGFPGTIASFRQQAGRAGRRGQSSVVFMVARDDPMDMYLVHHPEALLDRPVETSVFNPSNPYVLRGHLYCAAVEAPLTDEEVDAVDGHDIVTELAQLGLLRRRGNRWFAAQRPAGVDELPTPDTAHAAVDIRGGTGLQVMIIDGTDGRLLGTIDSHRAMSQVHQGAVYLHRGESFIVDELDMDNGIAFVHEELPDYTTRANSTTDITLVEVHQSFELRSGIHVASTTVEVADRVTGYVRRLADGTIGDHIPLELPESRLTTHAVAYTVDPLVLTAAGISASEIPGALHAAEHAAIGILPLLATCDRWDIGGVSTALHKDTGLPTVFVYDGHPGGAGFSEEGFRRFRQWMLATYEAVDSCSCSTGCPSCVQSPKCGNGNSPLDKAAALKLLNLFR